MPSFFSAPLSHKHSPIILALFFVFAIYFMPTWVQPNVWPEKLDDPDAVLRLTVVKHLLQTGDLKDHLIDRTNPPTGTVTPWTRPVDALVLLFYAPFRIFMPQQEALIASAMVMPAFLFAFGLLLLWRWMNNQGFATYLQLFILFSMVASGSVSGVFKPGGVDHHGLLLILSWVQFLLTYSIVQGEAGYGRWLGIITGLGIWVSPEFCIVTVPCLMYLGVCWLKWPQLYYHRIMSSLIAIFLVIAVAIFIEHSQPLTPFYDTVSMVYVALFGLLGVGFWCLRYSNNWSLADRILAAFTALLAVCAIMLHFYPDFYKLTMGGLDPYIVKHFLPIVSEQQSLFNTFDSIITSPALNIMAVGCICLFFIIGVWFLLFRVFRQSDLLSKQDIFVVTYAIFVFVCGFAVIRLYVYSILSTLFLLLPLLVYYQPRLQLVSDSIRSAIVMIFAMVPSMLLIMITSINTHNNVNKPDPEACGKDAMAFIRLDLMQYVPQPSLIISNSNDMPQILWWTPHSALAGNYHREPRALQSLGEFYGKDVRLAQAVVQRYKPDAVIVCTPSVKPEKWLYKIVHKKQAPPQWLRPINIDVKKNPNIQMYQIVR